MLDGAFFVSAQARLPKELQRALSLCVCVASRDAYSCSLSLSLSLSQVQYMRKSNSLILDIWRQAKLWVARRLE